MSTQSSSHLHGWSARDGERRTLLDLDLNYPPPNEFLEPTGPREEEAQHFNHWQRQAMENSDVFDEDIAIISPRKFAEARKNSRRRHLHGSCGVVIRFNGSAEFFGGLSDVRFWSPLSINNSASVQEQTINNLELRPSTESSSSAKTKGSEAEICYEPGENSVAAAAAGSGPSPSLRCAICIGQLVEETSTKCGHVFCKDCIEAAIATQHRCPICRRKLRKRDVMRIYLPFST